MALAIIKNTIPVPIQININGHMNLNHFSYGTLPIDRYPINTAEVGMIEFVKPSPNWNAITAVCLVIPNKSDSGIIIGIVAEACPLPEGIKKFIIICTIYIPITDKALGKALIAFAKLYTTVSMINPSVITIKIPRATPTTSAPKAIDFAPTTNSLAILLGPRPPIKPLIIPMARKVEPISTIYQPYLNTPVIITAKPTITASSISLCLLLICGILDKSIFVYFCAISNSATILLLGSFLTFSEYLIIYIAVIIRSTTNFTILNPIPENNGSSPMP